MARAARAAYRASAECPGWIAFLEQIFDGDQELVGFLKMVYVEGGSLVRKPVFEGAVEPFQLPQGLGVVGGRVDHLHTEVVETLLEHDFCAVESSSETQPVVGEDLAGQPVTGGSQLKGVPGQLPGGSRTSDRSQQIPRMIIDQIHHRSFGIVGTNDLGGVDLPQIVGDLPLKALVGLRAAPRLLSDQAIANQHLMDRGHRRRINPSTSQFGANPSRSPPGMILTHHTDP